MTTTTNTIPSQLQFNIDAFDPTIMKGWIRHTESTTPVTIELIVNDTPTGTFRADLFRQDLKKIREDGCFAFSLSPFGEINWKSIVPQNAKIQLREKSSGHILANTVWDGSASEEQKGIKSNDGCQMRINKGMLVIPLSERSNEWKNAFLHTASQMAKDSIAAGFNVCASYGTLLGLTREGKLIDHDDDIDLMFVSSKSTMLDAAEEFGVFQSYLKANSYRVTELSNGQIHARASNGCTIDIFLAWIENGKLSLTFTVKQSVEYTDIFPLNHIEILGHPIPTPRNPESLLQAIYGPNWRTPDPAFEWRRSKDVEDFFAPIHNYQKMANAEYWQDYYSAPKNEETLDAPSQFALFTLSIKKKPSLIIDLGCGNGRDTLFFASQGLQTYGLDYADTAITKNQNKANHLNLSHQATFQKLDVTNLIQTHNVVQKISNIRTSAPLCVYSRFFLHALDENAEGAALLLISQLLSGAEDWASLEFRTIQDENRKKVTPSHYRRYINVDHFLRKAEMTYGLICTYRVEGLGYAVYMEDDAYVARLILQKRITL